MEELTGEQFRRLIDLGLISKVEYYDGRPG